MANINKKPSRFKKGVRVASGIITAGLVGLATTRGIKERNATRSAEKFKQETVSQINLTPSGKATTLIYTKSLNRRHPEFKKNVELKASAIRGLEQAIKKHKSNLSVSRIMNTLENSYVHTVGYKFEARQIKYANSSSLKEAFKIYNSLPLSTRKMLYEMSKTKGTNANLTRLIQKEKKQSLKK
jgi:hypothetical protein